MSNYTTVAETKEIPSGERKRVEINGRRISIFNINNAYYAINDTCPHKGTAPLIRGELDGLGIKCPIMAIVLTLKQVSVISIQFLIPKFTLLRLRIIRSL